MDPAAVLSPGAGPGEVDLSVDLAVDLAGVRLPNPLVLASGILGTHASLMERAARCGAGAVTAKSCGPGPRGGHVNPSCVDLGPGLLNAIGLANPGAAAEVALLAETRARLIPLGVPLIASIFADTVDNFARVAEVVARAEPDLIEVNISCPNVNDEFGEPFAGSCPAAAAVTAAVKGAVGLPVIIKLAPNVPDIGRIAQAVVAAGADALCAINTMPAMAIDVESGQPLLANRTGGLSGPALKPIAVQAIWQIARAVDVPIIGTGGVMTGEDAVELLSAGATAVGVGSVVAAEGPAAFGRIRDELAAWLAARRLTLAEVRGRAHAPADWPERPTPAPVPAGGHATA
jgi:dihydroorotate dehydrogenase (NAD+) catalytic subunit